MFFNKESVSVTYLVVLDLNEGYIMVMNSFSTNSGDRCCLSKHDLHQSGIQTRSGPKHPRSEIQLVTLDMLVRRGYLSSWSTCFMMQHETAGVAIGAV